MTVSGYASYDTVGQRRVLGSFNPQGGHPSGTYTTPAFTLNNTLTLHVWHDAIQGMSVQTSYGTFYVQGTRAGTGLNGIMHGGALGAEIHAMDGTFTTQYANLNPSSDRVGVMWKTTISYCLDGYNYYGVPVQIISEPLAAGNNANIDTGGTAIPTLNVACVASPAIAQGDNIAFTFFTDYGRQQGIYRVIVTNGGPML